MLWASISGSTTARPLLPERAADHRRRIKMTQTYDMLAQHDALGFNDVKAGDRQWNERYEPNADYQAPGQGRKTGAPCVWDDRRRNR